MNLYKQVNKKIDFKGIFIDKPYVCVVGDVSHMGVFYMACGFSKWNPNDQSIVNELKKLLQLTLYLEKHFPNKNLTVTAICELVDNNKIACGLVDKLFSVSYGDFVAHVADTIEELEWSQDKGIKIAKTRAIHKIIRSIKNG